MADTKRRTSVDSLPVEDEKTAEDTIDVDDLLGPLGGFGKFQIINIASLCLIVFLCTFSELGYVLTASSVKHRCLISECETSWGDDGKPWLSAAIPKTDAGEWDSCLRNYNNISTQTCSTSSFSNVSYECDDFVYETTEWTIQREDWDLHCDGDKYWLSLIGSLNNAGQVIGSLYVGYISDSFGRKAVIVILTVVCSLIGIVKSFSVNYIMMATLETIEGTMSVALFNGAFVLSLEIVEPKHRVLAGTTISTAYALGEVIMGFVQWLTLDWRTTLRILYAPFLLVVILWWTVPESVRWLLDNHRPEEAKAVLQRIAKTNKKEFPEAEVEMVLKQRFQKKEKSQNIMSVYVEMLRSKRMRLRVAASYLLWLLDTFVYFGMTVSSVSISNDKFLNYVLNGVIEILGYVVAYFVLDRVGRKITLLVSLFLCGIACILDAYIPSDDDSWSWAILVLYLIGKFGASISFFACDVYTTELFPTSIRATMMATGLLMGKCATILAPEVPLLGEIYKPLPLLLFGGMATLGGFITLIFPETLNSKLPDTIEEAENLGRKKPKTTDS